MARKQPPQYPGVRAASSTSIEIRFTYQGRRCEERIKLKPSPANLKSAFRHREAILDAIYHGTFDYSVTFPDSPRALEFAPLQGDVTTVRAYLWDWLKLKQQTTKASTYDGYKKIVKNVLSPAFGDLALTELTRRVVRQWALDQTQASNKRIANVVSVLRSALQVALDDELIEVNPLIGWNFTRPDGGKTSEPDPFSLEEQAAILEAMEPQIRNYYQFAFWTGLRTSELIALEWADIDWHGGTVRISKAKAHAAAAAETTKTRASIRDVQLRPLAIEALKAQREHSQLHPSGVIFLHPRLGQPFIDYQVLLKTFWTPALRRAKVRYRNQYQTRHTFASMALSAGENPVWVARQMGHKDWTMIARVYGKWMQDADPEAGNKLDKLGEINPPKMSPFCTPKDTKIPPKSPQSRGGKGS